MCVCVICVICVELKGLGVIIGGNNISSIGIANVKIVKNILLIISILWND